MPISVCCEMPGDVRWDVVDGSAFVGLTGVQHKLPPHAGRTRLASTLLQYSHVNCPASSASLHFRPPLPVDQSGASPWLEADFPCISAQELAKTAWALSARAVQYALVRDGSRKVKARRAGQFDTHDLANITWLLASLSLV